MSSATIRHLRRTVGVASLRSVLKVFMRIMLKDLPPLYTLHAIYRAAQRTEESASNQLMLDATNSAYPGHTPQPVKPNPGLHHPTKKQTILSKITIQIYLHNNVYPDQMPQLAAPNPSLHRPTRNKQFSAN